MSVRVNLLPREAVDKQEAARQRNMVGAAFLVLLLLLALAFWFQTTRVDDARAERDEAQEELQALQAREAQLGEFRDLEEQVAEANDVIATALDGELSYAGMLQDVAAVMPDDSALTDLEITNVEEVGPDGDQPRRIVARMLASGESLTGHAPGVERLLIELDKIQAFFDVYFTDSTTIEEDEDFVSFGVEIDVGEEARTRRYVDGVPGELR